MMKNDCAASATRAIHGATTFDALRQRLFGSVVCFHLVESRHVCSKYNQSINSVGYSQALQQQA
jgi:hypothetical protein